MVFAIGEWSPSNPHLMQQEEGDPSWLGSEPLKCNTTKVRVMLLPWEDVIHLTNLISSLARVGVFKMRGVRSCASVDIGEMIGLKPNPSLLIVEEVICITLVEYLEQPCPYYLHTNIVQVCMVLIKVEALTCVYVGSMHSCQVHVFISTEFCLRVDTIITWGVQIIIYPIGGKLGISGSQSILSH